MAWPVFSGLRRVSERLEKEKVNSTKVLVDSKNFSVNVQKTKALIATSSRMSKKKILTLTNAEHRIMEVVWARGSATVADVVEALKGKDAYTTILTLMRILKVKGYLASHKEGRAFVFTPKVDRDTAARKAVDLLLSKFFSGSASELVLAFLREEELTPQELDDLKVKITETRENDHEQ
jgi:BlaI family penicillinase repressor